MPPVPSVSQRALPRFVLLNEAEISTQTSSHMKMSYVYNESNISVGFIY